MAANVSTKRTPATVPGRDTEVVRASLLRAAASEFASRGFAGARLEAIAAEAGATRAMIYYYFGGREGLYIAVLENAYREIWLAEQAIDTDGLAPDQALRKLVEFRVDYYVNHPVFVSLVAIENQHEARYLKQLHSMPSWSGPSLARTSEILIQGQASGVFRKDIDVLDLYQLIVSLGFFNASNRYTFGAIFGRNWSDVEHVRQFISDAVLRYADARRPDGR
ncbi:TetR family transcriptional regulator [Azohydromonas australica]|uniref:TetR family transcriptional regulator n=1 Tax=Azohydromonas australica TaxID=364039 RepID=UPI00048CBECC|nr:TetR family transcriptional regulator [Azohydromonas australica]